MNKKSTDFYTPQWPDYLPDGWEFVRTDWVATEHRETADPSSLDHEQVFHYSIPVIEETGDGRYEDPTEIRSKKLILQGGEVLVSKLNPGKSRVLQTKNHSPLSIASGEFVPLRANENKILPKYLETVFLSEPVRQYLDGIATSATRSHQRVNPQEIRTLRFPKPPVDIQQKILSYLWYNIDHIDALIKKNKRLLELLNEKSESLITKLVTIGSSPKTQMQDSNIDWLGEIPENWDIIRTRYLCKITTGSGDTQDAEPDGEYPFVVRSQRLERSNTYTFDGEGVLTAGDGNVGEVFHHIEGKFHYHQRVYLFYDFQNILPLYFYYYMKAFFSTVALGESAKSTVDSLRRPMLLDFPVAVPPIIEQESIVESIKNSTTNIYNLHSKIEIQISLLEKKRQALITAAVTGQIEVSDWAHPAEEACVFL